MKLIELKILIILLFSIVGCNKKKNINQTVSNRIVAHNIDSINMIKKKFLESDTILLIRHTGRIETGVNPQNENPPIMINERINNSIIKTKYVAKRKDVDILLESIFDSTNEYIPKKCGFNPHHAIVLIKAKKISFINICFACEEFETSKDLIWIRNFSFKNWKNLETLFTSKKLKKY